jgi:prohibitin 2
MNPGKLIGFGIIIVVIVLALAQSTYVVDPGFRGVLVTLGKVSDEAKPEGFGTKSPFISHLVRVPVRQLTQSVDAECYSSDLQQLTVVPAGALPHSRIGRRQNLQGLCRRSL